MEAEDKLFIKDLSVRTKRGYLCVRIMRKWNYDGNVPGGPVFYIGLLFADEQGNAIYAQIPQSEIQRLEPQLILDKVYTIRRFNVRVSKAGYVPFDAGIMIQLTAFTTITPSKTAINKFPSILYRITPFNQISTSGQATMKYIDVIGIVIKEDLPKTACPKGKEYVSTLKEITIQDLSGAQLTVTLWEDHVQQFQIKDSSPTEPAHSIVALFCGCLPKKIFNKTQVNAGNACRWFLNPNIPEAQPFYDSLQGKPIPLQRMLPAGSSSQAEVRPRVLEHKTVAELNAINPYDFPEEGCKCTVKITDVPADQEWWYMGCELCKKRLRSNGGTYYCTRCNWSTAIPLYKLTFFGADETAEARFFSYDVNARQIIRRNCDSLLRAVNNVSGLPEQILRTVGRTYTFAVGLTKQSYNSMTTRAYLIDSCVFKPVPETSVAANSLTPERAVQLTAADTDAMHSATHTSRQKTLESAIQEPAILQQTPPPNLDAEETPNKESASIETTASKKPECHAHNVRKRLFDDSTSTNETDPKGEEMLADKHKETRKKSKNGAAAQDAHQSESKLSKSTVAAQAGDKKSSPNA